MLASCNQLHEVIMISCSIHTLFENPHFRTSPGRFYDPFPGDPEGFERSFRVTRTVSEPFCDPWGAHVLKPANQVCNARGG